MVVMIPVSPTDTLCVYKGKTFCLMGKAQTPNYINNIAVTQIYQCLTVWYILITGNWHLC